MRRARPAPLREAGIRITMARKKPGPYFTSESAEREFWATADSTRHIDWKHAQRIVFPNLRPALKTISLRLPELMLEELKLLANKRDVPYQSLLKVFLAERIEAESWQTTRARGSTSTRTSVAGRRSSSRCRPCRRRRRRRATGRRASSWEAELLEALLQRLAA